MLTPNSLAVGPTRRGLCVRVAGRGTMGESPALHAFAAHVLGKPDCPALEIDLTDCSYLDSTFLGCLVSLHRTASRSGTPGRLAIVGPAEHLRRLLGPSHLDALLPLRDDHPERIGEELPIPLQAIDPDELGRHVLECHRRLTELGDDNAAAFGPVADRLARELDRIDDARPAASRGAEATHRG